MSGSAYQRRSIWILALFALLLSLTACNTTDTVEGSTIDGWTVGAPDSCPPPNFPIGQQAPNAWDCGATLALYLAEAREGFDRRDPEHAHVRRAALHHNGGIARFSGASWEIAVFELIDGSYRAIAVGHVGVEHEHLQTFGDGPDDDPAAAQ